MDNLRLLGISEKEQVVYKTLSDVGIVSATELAKLTKVKRPTIYLYLENLKEAGLVSESINQKKKYFQAVNPKALNEIVKQKITELENLSKSIPSLVIELESARSKRGRSKGQLYRGVAGVRALVDEIANSQETVYLLGSIKGLHKYLGPDLLDKIYNKPRRRKMATDYLIADWASSTVKKFFEESGTFTKIRFLPPDIPPNGAFIAFGNKIIVAEYFPEPQAVMIEEPALVSIFKLAFSSLWKDLAGKNIPPHP